jgi:hypothetical protein
VPDRQLLEDSGRVGVPERQLPWHCMLWLMARQLQWHRMPPFHPEPYTLRPSTLHPHRPKTRNPESPHFRAAKEKQRAELAAAEDRGKCDAEREALEARLAAELRATAAKQEEVAAAEAELRDYKARAQCVLCVLSVSVDHAACSCGWELSVLV